MKTSSTAQPLTIPYIETHRLKSKINDVEYELFVALTLGYQDDKNDYPIIFTTDPNFIIPILLGSVRSLASMIPDAIIVGVGHADLDFKELDEVTHNARVQIHRAHDLLAWKFDKFTKDFTHSDLELEAAIVKHSGHAKEFKDFIATEVIPFTNKTYRAKPERTLISHSFGGVFALCVINF